MILSLLVSFTIFPPPPHLTFLLIELEQNISLGFHGDALPTRELSEETPRQQTVCRGGAEERQNLAAVLRSHFELLVDYLVNILKDNSCPKIDIKESSK